MNTVDMATPVTRGELREELASFELRFDQLDARFGELDARFGELDARFGELEQRFDDKLERLEQRIEQKFDHKLERLEQRIEQKFDHKLEFWGGALLARITESERRAQAWNAEAQARSAESEQRLLTELGRHARAIQEAMTAQISVIDEKYADLPARVRRIEAKVFATRRR